MRVALPFVEHPGFVAFDFDGTLTDYLRADQQAMEAVRHEVAPGVDAITFFEASGEEIMAFHALVEQGSVDRRTMHTWRLTATARRFGMPPPRASAVAAYRAALIEYTVPSPGSTELLRTLADRGTRLAIVTNAYDGDEQRARISGCFPDVFDAVVVAGAGGRMKPDPAPFQDALDSLREPAAAGVYVGDSPRHDVPGALTVGLPVVIVHPSAAVREHARDLGATAVATLSHCTLGSSPLSGTLGQRPRRPAAW